MNKSIMPMGVYCFNVGAFECMAVSDGMLAQDPRSMAVNATPDERSAFIEANFMMRELTAAQLTGLFINTGAHRVLIDSGIGARVPGAGQMLLNLHAAGIDPATIDTVIISHAHGDHIGGLYGVSAPDQLSFPKARHIIGQIEWDFWTDLQNLEKLPIPPEFKQRFLYHPTTVLPAIRPLVDLIAADTEIVPGIHALAAYGHTPGQLGFIIASGAETLIVTGDALTNHRISPEKPDWVIGGDMDAAQTVSTRRRLLDQITTDRTLMMSYHFPWPNLGHIVKMGEVWRYLPTPWQWSS